MLAQRQDAGTVGACTDDSSRPAGPASPVFWNCSMIAAEKRINHVEPFAQVTAFQGHNPAAEGEVSDPLRYWVKSVVREPY
jgi:hypothetical protein